MSVPIPTGYEYNPNLGEKTVSFVKKTAPGIIGRTIQIVMYGIFQLARFIIQMFKDATSK